VHFPPCVRVPIYFRFCKLHPISYPPSPFHSPCFISSSDPIPSPSLFMFSTDESRNEPNLHNFRFRRFFPGGSAIAFDRRRGGGVVTPANFGLNQVLVGNCFPAGSLRRVFFANFNGAGPGLSSVTMKFTANTITGLDWAAKVHSHGSYVHFETTAPCKLNYFIFPASLGLRGIAIKDAHLRTERFYGAVVAHFFQQKPLPRGN
jgi:hypothetical protein